MPTSTSCVTTSRSNPSGGSRPARVDYNITDNHRFTSAFNYNWFTDAPDTLNDFEPQWPGFPAFGGQTSIR